MWFGGGLIVVLLYPSDFGNQNPPGSGDITTEIGDPIETEIADDIIMET